MTQVLRPPDRIREAERVAVAVRPEGGGHLWAAAILIENAGVGGPIAYLISVSTMNTIARTIAVTPSGPW